MFCVFSSVFVHMLQSLCCCTQVDNRIARLVKDITSKKREMKKMRPDAEESKRLKLLEDTLKGEISEAERKLRSLQV